MKQELVTIKNKNEETLQGDHFRCADNDKVIIVIPGYGGTRKGGAKILADVLVKENHNCIIFDNSGVGDSEGDFPHKTVGDWCEDVQDIVAFSRTLGYNHIALLGTSTGAGIALETALKVPIERILVRAPAIDYKEIRLNQYGEKGVKKAEEQGFFNFEKYKVNYSSYKESLKHTLYGKVGNLDAPILIIHGSLDQCVPLTQSQKIVEELPNATLLVIDGGDHSSGVNKDYTLLHEAIRDWFSQW